METLKTVGVKNLKNNLSAYLRDVQRGVRVLITDRDRIVAELREPLTSVGTLKDSPLELQNPVLVQWIQEAKVRLPRRQKKPCSPSFLHSPEGTGLSLLNEDRGE